MRQLTFIAAFLFTIAAHAREWKSVRQYRNTTGADSLGQHDWLRKDRKNETLRWQDANAANINAPDGYTHYNTFAQKRDFYRWMDNARCLKGHEVKWTGNAYIITKQLVYLDNLMVRALIVHNRKFMQFVRQSNKLILKNIYPDIQELYTTAKPLKGGAAYRWDSAVIYKEQCIVLDTLYQRQPAKVLKKFNRMAAGKGIYGLVLRKPLRMKGDIRDCKTRCDYGLHTMRLYYDEQHNLK